MSTDNLRAAALRRSKVRDFVHVWLRRDAARFDTTALVTEIMDSEDRMYGDMESKDFWKIARRHEFDEDGLTPAILEKALDAEANWIAVIRRPDGEVQTLNLDKGDESTTPETIEATLRKFVNFPEGTSITILPLVG